MRKRGGTASGFESVLKTKDGRSIPVLISASVLLDEDGEEVGTVGFATDLRARKREEEELRKAHDELEKRVEERTTELKAARERLRYLMTVTPAIVYTNQASDYTCTFVSENVSRIMGFSAWEMLEDKDFWTVRLHPEDAERVFEEMAPLIEKGGGTHRISLPPSRRPLHLDPGHVQRDPRRARAPVRDRRARGPTSPTARRRRRRSANAWR